MGGAADLVTRRRIGIVLALLALIVLGVFVWQAISASRALLDARTEANQVKTLIRSGDFAGASKALESLRNDAAKAHDSTDGWLWDLGRHLPFIGSDLGAVQTVSAVLDTATRENAPIALQLSEDVRQGRFRPVNGKVDLALVEQLTPAVRRAANSIDRAGRDLDTIRTDKLTFPFADLVGDLQTQVDTARTAATATSTAFGLLPDMLGQVEPRNYLLMIQNPAELRATGGLPGSLAVLHADKGRLTMAWQGSATDINGPSHGFPTPVVKLPADTEQQYGPTMATDMRDVNFSPDFRQAAQIAASMVSRREHVTIDGVVSVDPLALAAMMTGTGPIYVGNGITLSATNVVSVLLNQTYQLISDPLAQDDFFKTVARRMFDSVMGGQGSQEQAIKGLTAGVDEHRVQLWSARPDEEAAIAGTAISGEVGGNEGRTAHVGMYLNNSSASKMDYYLQFRSAASAVDCRNDRSQDLRASMVFTSTMPTDVSHLSIWVTGDGTYAPKGTITFNLRLYGPYGGEITGLTVNGANHSITADQDHGRQVALLPVALKPGEQLSVTADIRTAPGQDGDGVFDFTPGMVPAPNGVKIATAC